MARKKKEKVVEEKNVESTDQVEVQAEEVPEVEVPAEQSAEEEIVDFQLGKEQRLEEEKQDAADLEIKTENAKLEEGYVIVNRFHRSAYAGLKGKIVQDLVSSYKLETDLGLVIMPKDQVS